MGAHTLTTKQAAALRALDERGSLRVSNYTDLDAGVVYWQTAEALVGRDLAKRTPPWSNVISRPHRLEAS